MRYIIPHYFEAFRCTAAECTDSCCVGWQIMIDETSLERYEQTSGQFGERLRQSIDWKEGRFHQDACKRCAFLNEDNLCDMQMIGGEQMLCATCRDYPRHMEEYEGLREGSLSLSCIESAKIILGIHEPVQFLMMEDDEEDEEYEDFDYLLFDKLMDVRECIIAILQNREADIKIRMSLAFDIAKQVQQAIDDKQIGKVDQIVKDCEAEDVFFEYQKKMENEQSEHHNYFDGMRKLFRLFSKMETLKDDWPEYVKKAEWTLFSDGHRSYEENRARYEKEMQDDYENLSRYMEHLMVYFVYVYFCGAVYDGEVLGKMRLAVAGTVLIREMIYAVWLKKGEVSFSDIVDVAHRFSREIEHSDVNLVRFERLLNNSSLYPLEELIREGKK